MPRAYRRPRTRRSRRRFKRRPRLSNLWPATKVVKFKIALSKVFSVAGGGALAGAVYKANSLNDPTGTESANLPLGLDQWAGLYSKYKVLGSQIKVMAHPYTITGAAVVGLHLTSSSSLLTNHDHYRELPNTSLKILSPDIDIAKVQMNYSIHKYPFHIKNVRDADDQEGSFTTSPGDPTDLAYFHFFAQDATRTEAVDLDIQVIQEFIVLLYDRVIPTRSSL